MEGIKVITVENNIHTIQGTDKKIVEGHQIHRMKVGDRLLIHPSFYIVTKRRSNYVICKHEFDVIGLTKERDRFALPFFILGGLVIDYEESIILKRTDPYKPRIRL